MESQMSHDLQLMKRRKEIGELSKTWSGKALKALGWAFSIYCMYRVAMVGSFANFNFNERRKANLCVSVVTTQSHLWGSSIIRFKS